VTQCSRSAAHSHEQFLQVQQIGWWSGHGGIRALYEQDGQLSQRDRAAGCVIVFAKSRTLELRDNDLRTL